VAIGTIIVWVVVFSIYLVVKWLMLRDQTSFREYLILVLIAAIVAIVLAILGKSGAVNDLTR